MRTVFGILVVMVLCFGCETQETFKQEDVQRYESMINNGFDRDALDYNDPYLLTWLLFKMEEPHHQWSMTGIQNGSDEIVITLIREGFMDDSLYGDKRLIKYVREEGHWRIASMEVAYKCQKGRGQQTFGTDLCS